MKTLVIVRHGEAEAARSSGVGADAERALTAVGRAQIAQTSVWLKQYFSATAGIHAASTANIALFASPYRRTAQSADILHTELAISSAVQSEELLIPDADLATTIQWLSTIDAETVVLASHMPIVALLVERLTAQSIAFTPAASAILVNNPDTNKHWQLLAKFTPVKQL